MLDDLNTKTNNQSLLKKNSVFKNLNNNNLPIEITNNPNNNQIYTYSNPAESIVIPENPFIRGVKNHNYQNNQNNNNNTEHQNINYQKFHINPAQLNTFKNSSNQFNDPNTMICPNSNFPTNPSNNMNGKNHNFSNNENNISNNYPAFNEINSINNIPNSNHHLNQIYQAKSIPQQYQQLDQTENSLNARLPPTSLEMPVILNTGCQQIPTIQIPRTQIPNNNQREDENDRDGKHLCWIIALTVLFGFFAGFYFCFNFKKIKRKELAVGVFLATCLITTIGHVLFFMVGDRNRRWW